MWEPGSVIVGVKRPVSGIKAPCLAVAGCVENPRRSIIAVNCDRSILPISGIATRRPLSQIGTFAFAHDRYKLSHTEHILDRALTCLRIDKWWTERKYC